MHPASWHVAWGVMLTQKESTENEVTVPVSFILLSIVNTFWSKVIPRGYEFLLCPWVKWLKSIVGAVVERLMHVLIGQTW